MKKYSWSLIYVPDRYVRLQEMWYGDYSHVMVAESWLYDKLVQWRNCWEQFRALNKTNREEIDVRNEEIEEIEIDGRNVVCQRMKKNTENLRDDE